jgi:hypothetical protein
MLLHYQRGGFPAYEKADEDGQPVPCALGQPWVNADTQATLAHLRIPRTDPWGKPLPGESLDGVRERDRGPSGPLYAAASGASTARSK